VKFFVPPPPPSSSSSSSYYYLPYQLQARIRAPTHIHMYIIYTLGSGYRRRRRCRHVKSTGRDSRDEIVFERSDASASYIIYVLDRQKQYIEYNMRILYTMLSISITIYHNVRRVHNGDLRTVFVHAYNIRVNKTPHARDTTRGAYVYTRPRETFLRLVRRYINTEGYKIKSAFSSSSSSSSLYI